MDSVFTYKVFTSTCIIACFTPCVLHTQGTIGLFNAVYILEDSRAGESAQYLSINGLVLMLHGINSV